MSSSALQGSSGGRGVAFRVPPRFARPLGIGAFVLFWLLLLLALRLLPQTAVVVEMRIYAEGAGSAQWYFDRGTGMSEAESVSAPLRPGTNELRFHLPTGIYRALRFDPINNGSHVRIESLHWTIPSGTPPLPDLTQLVPSANIARTAMGPGGLDVWPATGTDDPQMILRHDGDLDLTRSWRPLRDDAIAALEAAVLLALLGWLAIARLDTATLVRCALFAAAGLIIGLAALATVQGSVHPDEFSHLGAYQYYADHTLPPAVDDPATVPSTSAWGYSYLFELNSTYWLAGRLMAPLAALFNADLYAARTFQLLLWGGLCCVALWRRRFAIALSVLLLSPQIWYVFAYFNSDAFPLFVAMIAVLSISGEALPEWLQGKRSFNASVLLFAICLGLLVVCKANYVAIVPGLLLWLCVLYLDLRWLELIGVLAALALLGFAVFLNGNDGALRWFCIVAGMPMLFAAAFSVLRRTLPDQALRHTVVRLACLTALGLATALPRIAWDIHVNGGPGEKAQRILQVEEARARPDLRPSVIAAGNGGAATGLRTRGIGLSQLLFEAPYQWAKSSGESTFGVYGYMNVFAPAWIYLLLMLSAAGVVALATFALRRAMPREGGRLLLLAIGVSGLVVESSVLHSWIDALQPQGRYLFPAIAFIALIVVHAESALPRSALRLLLATSFLGGGFSFVLFAYPAFVHG